MPIYGGGNPFRGKTWTRGAFGEQYREMNAQTAQTNPGRYWTRDLAPYGVGETLEVNTGPRTVPLNMSGLFDSDPDVVFRGCENPGAAATYLATVKIDALLKGFTAGVIAGLVGAFLADRYLLGRKLKFGE